MVAAHEIQGRPQLLRRRSSIELRVCREHSTSRKRKFMVLSFLRSSSLAFVTSLFLTYAWIMSIGVGSSILTFSLVDSAQITLRSFQEDQRVFQGFLDKTRGETQAARKDLELGTSKCILQDSLVSDHATTFAPCSQQS